MDKSTDISVLEGIRISQRHPGLVGDFHDIAIAYVTGEWSQYDSCAGRVINALGEVLSDDRATILGTIELIECSAVQDMLQQREKFRIVEGLFIDNDGYVRKNGVEVAQLLGGIDQCRGHVVGSRGVIRDRYSSYIGQVNLIEHTSLHSSTLEEDSMDNIDDLASFSDENLAKLEEIYANQAAQLKLEVQGLAEELAKQEKIVADADARLAAYARIRQAPDPTTRFVEGCDYAQEFREHAEELGNRTSPYTFSALRRGRASLVAKVVEKEQGQEVGNTGESGN